MWRFAGSDVDGGKFFIEGLNVWTLEWKSVEGECAYVKDPIYHQDFAFGVYTITDGTRTVKFAAGEFSNCIWGFYVAE